MCFVSKIHDLVCYAFIVALLAFKVKIEDKLSAPFWVDDVKHYNWDDQFVKHADITWKHHLKHWQMKYHL